MAPSETPPSHKLEEFAEDVGRLLGTTKAKADQWMSQRQNIVATLTKLRDEATRLLADMGHEAQSMVTRKGDGSNPVEGVFLPQPGQRRRRLSKAARAAISAAQKARWARTKAGGS